MQGLFTRLLAAFLALTLLFTAETMAMARGAPAPVGEIILCTSHGVVAVPVDAEGNPTEPVHICPDCLTFFAALQADSSGVVPWRTLAPQPFPAAKAWQGFPAIPPHHSARAPPARV